MLGFVRLALLAAWIAVAAAQPVDSAGSAGPTRTLERRTTTSLLPPFNTASPAPTPAFVHPPIPPLLPVEQVAALLTVTTATTVSVLGQAALQLVNSATTLNIDGVLKSVPSLVNGLLCGLFGCGGRPKYSDPRPPLQQMGSSTCLDSKYNASVINSLFYYGGAGTTVNLCPNAQINLETSIYFYAANQTLQTGGLPFDSTRAVLTITDAGTTCAIYGADDGNDGVTLKNVIINGNRAGLGWASNGLALIEMGGNNRGQTIQNIKSYDPRGWSALHIIEGYQNSCSGSRVLNNELGPSGHAPSGAQQFRMVKMKRDSGTYPPGQWADGLSLACKNSIATGNTITDATDGAIVIFGAPGSMVIGNTIIADQRQLLGGVNAVDYNPFAGDYSGTIVSGNRIIAKNSLLKVGIAAGPSTWYSNAAFQPHTHGGSFTGNTFSTGATGYFGYGISVNSHDQATFTDNSFYAAEFGGVFSSSCQPEMPAMQPLVYDPTRILGNTLQDQFVPALYELAICVGPGARNNSKTIFA
ncbi:hypothetical protein Rt10032_c13g5092 [Rhodotorula toruloides]|uniref:Right handed beta helix domain-containing protein n=1 Tax=Rhodotorula toruloides TaxID=5286 RepID=A0A511KMF1_RHOTO|nr:hypothetical protein Rt10032_c13g5092 [Rhodotorula toruloides]